MHNLVQAIIKKNTTAAVDALYAFQQSAVLEASALGKEEFGAEDFARAAESAFAELELPPETRRALQDSSGFFQSFSTILENMDRDHTTRGENIFSVLSQSATACCVSSRITLFELEQGFILTHPLHLVLTRRTR